MSTAKYHKPTKRVHRGFYYLDDETVINSLSAVEAGKVDEVVAKIISAREGGFGGGLGVQGTKLEGGKKSSSSFEEEMVRTRTRFSVFEIWYQALVESKAIGRFEGWGPDILNEVEPGETVEFKAQLELVPLQILFRLFLWYAEQAKTQGTPFSVTGQALKNTKEAERVFRTLLGNPEQQEFLVVAKPEGDLGPVVVMQLADRWMIGQVGHLSGHYSIVGQVDQILTEREELPALRLTLDAPPTPAELETLREVVKNFVEPAKELGVAVSADDSGIKGPGLWLTPIAIFR